MNSRVVINTTWSQIERNSVNSQEIFSDEGSISYDASYTSGTDSNQINAVFHEASVLAANGGNKTFDLTSVSGSIFGNDYTENFTGVKILTIKNLSSDEEAYLDINVFTANGFDAIFGNPTGLISISPSGCIHRNNRTTGFPVGSSEKYLVMSNNSDFPCYYEILIEGNK